MSAPFITEYHNGVKQAHVASNRMTTVEEVSSSFMRLILSKSPDRKEVDVFISRTGALGYKESHMVINKEEALKTIYGLKVFLNITNEDQQTFEESLVL